MVSQPYTLHPLTPQDTPSLYHTYSSAFAPTTFQPLAFPLSIPPSSMSDWYTKRFRKQLEKPHVHAFKIVYNPTASESQNAHRTEKNEEIEQTGEIVAFSRWNFPYTPTSGEEKEKGEGKGKEGEDNKDDYPSGTNLELTSAKFGGLDRMREKYVNTKEDYVCTLLVVHPTHQAQGLGTRLLHHILSNADAEGRKVYIEATDAGYPLYKKLGFKQVDVLPIDMSKWGVEEMGSNRIMIREPVLGS